MWDRQPRRSQPHGCKLGSDGGQVARNRSYFLHFPSSRRQAARDGAELAGTMRDGGHRVDGPLAYVMGDGSDHAGTGGTREKTPVRLESPALPTQVRILSLPHPP
jgi:hypothetical protein